MKVDRDVGYPILANVRSPSRLATLRKLALLDTAPEDSYDRVADLGRRVLGTPVALVSLVDVNRQFFKSCIGLDEPWQTSRETPLESSLCAHVVASGSSLAIPDTREDPVHHGNGAVSNLGVVAYLGYPLLIDGEIVGTLCVIDRSPREWSEDDIQTIADLAALVVAEMKLRLLAEERRAALQDRDRILAVVCHDLRTPLQSTLTTLGLMELDAVSAETQELIESIRQSTASMNRLVGDLLEVSALQFDKPSIDLERLNLPELLGELAQSAAARAGESGIELTISSQPTPDVLADHDRLRRALTNILDNAIRFTPFRGTIDVSCEVSDGEVLVSVSDSGPGIPESDLPRIFDWGWHAGHRENGGTGLGLSIAKSIIDAHGGRIWAENRDPHGASFSFALPAVV